MSLLKQEKKVLIDTHGKVLWALRTYISHGTHWLTGIFLPSHERMWLEQYHSSYRENVVVASRGTSKSFLHTVAATIKAVLYKGLGILVVSASGFRGGKLLFEDLERLFQGKLKSQRMPAPFLEQSVTIDTGKIIRRGPDRWTIPLGTQSNVMTVPTNNPDNLRGIRTNELIVDERNTFDGEVIGKVIRPMMNVGIDFRKTAAGSEGNKIYQVSTIDYSFRDWNPEIQAAERLVLKEYEAWKARKAGDWASYRRLMESDDAELRTASTSYSRVDYTDLVIPEVIVEEHTGRAYRVRYPLPVGVDEHEIKVWDERDKIHYYYTYPVDKAGLEAPLRAGTVDVDIWLAEQRNIMIATAGNVYPANLIRATAEVPIYSHSKVPGVPHMEEFYAPLLYTCGDPCVIGIDYARESDELGIVVIRIGELAEGKADFTLNTKDDKDRICIGNTSWNNVIWAESWRKWTATETAAHILKLYERYNVINIPRKAGGIGMDKGGGGSAVRDELALPDESPEEAVTEPKMRMYDPSDDDYKHYEALSDPTLYWNGLRLLKPTNTSNVEWTMGSKSNMQQGKMYLAYSDAPIWAHAAGFTTTTGQLDTANPEYQKMRIGHDGMRRLKSQLMRIQMKVSDSGVIKFAMPDAREKASGKKDLYSAYIYASHMMREHQIRIAGKEPKVPDAQPVIVNLSSSSRSSLAKNFRLRR